jgi:hypothetical protein
MLWFEERPFPGKLLVSSCFVLSAALVGGRAVFVLPLQ